ncbi:MAG: hypothetical protein HC830_12275 [Bacteroidetes bacterium]|nr:hypothetical protein [Bacteroidota bacterium]
MVAAWEEHDTGGNTSIAFDNTDIYKWSGKSVYRSEDWGYFDTTGKEIPYIKRDRDLGQTFQIKSHKSMLLKSITVMTGFGNNVVRKGTYGKNISVQLFEVSGEPFLKTNYSGQGIEAYHGFPHNRAGDTIPTERDDFLDGESFKTIALVRGGKFPSKKDFGFISEEVDVSPDDTKLKGRFIMFSIPDSISIKLEPAKKYAFLIMIDEKCDECGFTLANQYYGKYDGGHGIRRDGNGQFPPVPANPLKNFTEEANRKAYESAHFPSDFNARLKISPGTDGYPDVCTFRDLVFYIEAE